MNDFAKVAARCFSRRPIFEQGREKSGVSGTKLFRWLYRPNKRKGFRPFSHISKIY
jgi:hypothetical protein